jgi:YHS domain-containing protein
MNRLALAALLAGSIVGAAILDSLSSARGDDAETREIPPAFAPFEYLVGKWKGQGIPKDDSANKFRGWTETHSWAWIFAKGKPTGLTLTIDGGKFLAAGKLTYDPALKHYRLEGTGPKPRDTAIVFEGSLDRTGKLLVLDRVKRAGTDGKDSGDLRISLRANANFVRYTMTEDIKEPESVQYKHAIEVGLTKEGESFAGGATTTERTKCIVTGGAASMTLVYQGNSYSICCSGCKDEFNENPDKYIKKAALIRAVQAGKSKTDQPAPSRVSRFEDAFAGDVVDSPAAAPAKARSQKASPLKAKQADDAKSGDQIDSTDVKPAAKASSKPKAEPPPAAKPAARAATLLRLARSLEKDGKTTAALGYYRQIVKDYAATPSAKTAAERIKAIDKD